MQFETRTEQELAAIWTDVLGAAPTDPAVDFFESGGDSFLATKAVLLIRRTWGIGATVQLVIDHPVLGDLAKTIDDAVATGRLD